MRMILIDSREKSKIPELLKIEKNIEVLEVGDYAIIGPSESACVSVKSAEDYLGSITSDHLNEELIQMNANFDISVLMIHGNIDRALYYRKLPRQTVFAYMAGVISRKSPYGLKSVPSFVNFFTPDASGWEKDPYNKAVYDAVQFLTSLHHIITSDNIYRKPGVIKYKVPPEEEQLYAIQYLFKPTNVIGEVRAKEIQKKFKTIKAIVNATPEDFEQIDGIGKVIAQQMYDLLNKEVSNG